MNEIKQEIKRLHENGYSIAAIAARIDMPYGRVWEQVKFMRFTGELERRDRGITLPTVSILENGMNTTEDDFRAGKMAAQAAGLS